MAKISNFIGELRRRNVFRAGAAYTVLAWLTVQVADILLETFSAPPWIMKVVVVALAVGLPVTLVLAWLYELTISGIQRTEDVIPEESITYVTGKKLNFAIIGVLTVAVAMFAVDRFVWQQQNQSSANDSSIVAVGVLPFNIESRQIAPFFGQLSSDVTRLLQRSSRIRTASFDAIDALPANASPVEAATRLGVRYLINGAIGKTANAIRLKVSLFDRDAGEVVWEREFEDAHLQQTTNAVANEILLEIHGGPVAPAADDGDPEAYAIYLRAKQQAALSRMSDETERLYREAIAIDPRFAPALASLCDFLAGRFGTKRTTADFEEAERVCHRAWTIDAQSPVVQYALGSLYAESGQTEKARDAFASSLEINPGALNAQVAIAATYHEDDPELAENLLKRIIEQHPGSPNAYLSLQYLYWKQGRYAEAVEEMRWVARLLPDDEGVTFRLSSTMILAGQFAEAKALLIPLVENDSVDLGSVNSNLATILFFEGDFAGAAELYLGAIEKEPEDPLYYRNLGDAVWHMDSPEEAQLTFLEAIRLADRQLAINPDDSYALSSVLVSAASVGDVERYERARQKMIEKWESDPQTQYDFAIAASRLGEMEMAQDHARQAFELGYPVAFLRADPDIAASGATFRGPD
ncbi:MAG: tetratricopeptide repeat protein [Xanthomonadales bacterium]|nr:tetratricopeptide repeat protein [Gammaproteobacteria bacterium]MBT8052343.1 tetratricopeptide repeat protein [Gammaproteobacteria bacterium]NND56547.1 tetratricopeptide repeat protein [Xanthomonadales bacterium]NNK52554.1 tetratricopeptide repeat protein [Xanthomonadales bacterium]